MPGEAVGAAVVVGPASTVKVFGAHPSHSWFVDPWRRTMSPQ